MTVFGLIGTLVTGFLGMNIFSWGDETPITKFLLFMVVFVPSVLITLYTVRSSRQLAGFLEALSKRADPMSK